MAGLTSLCTYPAWCMPCSADSVLSPTQRTTDGATQPPPRSLASARFGPSSCVHAAGGAQSSMAVGTLPSAVSRTGPGTACVASRVRLRAPLPSSPLISQPRRPVHCCRLTSMTMKLRSSHVPVTTHWHTDCGADSASRCSTCAGQRKEKVGLCTLFDPLQQAPQT